MNATKATTRAHVSPRTKATRATPAEVVGKRLRKRRLEAKLSLRALGDKAQLSYEAVRLVEAGKGGVRALKKMLEVLKVSNEHQRDLISMYLN